MRVSIAIIACLVGLACAEPAVDRTWSCVKMSGDIYYRQYQSLGEFSLNQDPATGNFLLFGGADENSFYNDMWSMTQQGEWAQLSIAGELPPARDSHSAVIVNGVLYVIGGLVEGDIKGSNVMWMYNIKSNTWSKAPLEGDFPRESQFYLMMAVDGETIAVMIPSEPTVAYMFNSAANKWAKKETIGFGEGAEAKYLAGAQIVNGKVIALAMDGNTASLRVLSGHEWTKAGDDFELDLTNTFSMIDDAEKRVTMTAVAGSLVIPGHKQSIIIDADMKISALSHDNEDKTCAAKTDINNYHYGGMNGRILVSGGNDYYTPEMHMLVYEARQAGMSLRAVSPVSAIDGEEGIAFVTGAFAFIVCTAVVVVGAAFALKRASAVIDSSVKAYLDTPGHEQRIPLASERGVAYRSEGPVGDYIPPAL